MSRKKVLYILHGIQIGGVEVALMSAIPSLHKEFDLQVVALGKISTEITATLTPDEKSRLHAFDYPLYQYPFAIFRIISFILRFNPDIMISSLWRGSMIGVIAKKLRKRIHFFSFIHSSGTTHIFDRTFTSMAVRNADSVLVDSAATEKFVRTKIKPDATIQIVSFCLEPGIKQPRTHQVNRQEIRMMFLGRINAVKNLPKTVDTIHFLRSQGHHVILDLYGKLDGAEKELMDYIQEKDMSAHIRFKGELYHSKGKVMSDYDFLIQLSFREGMAMSVAEAMQNGLVCIVTPVGEIPNYATDMENAIFINTLDAAEWVPSMQKVEKVIFDTALYNRMSESARKQFENVKVYSDSLIEKISAY